MTITIEKKHLLGLLGMIVLCTIVFVIAQIALGKKVDYEATAKDAKINAYTVVNLSYTILNDYRKTWRSVIDDDVMWVRDEEGKLQYCSNFNDAISYRMKSYIHEGYFEVIDSLSNVVKENLKLMNDAPEKFQGVQKTLIAMYGDMNTLVSLVKEPKGSLMTFGSKVDELMMSFDKNYKETDLIVNIPEGELKSKMANIYEMISRTKLRKCELLYGGNKEAGEKYLAENAKKEGVKVLPSGVQYKVIKEGSGEIPKDSSIVVVHYEGKTIDGQVFDSSYDKEPVTFPANRVIKGWTEALVHMPVGSIWEVCIPQELAYGERSTGQLKPFSALIFKIELISIKK
jgi:FKBP-type peptidyl-prolyl cis-trans isomerase